MSWPEALPDNDEPVWAGYYDGGSWRTADGDPSDAPTHWSRMPGGPE